MTLILTNNRLALEMSELEVKARAGDPVAQELLEQQCRRAGRIHNSPAHQLKAAQRARQHKR